jgi:uncharacterized protein (TIGR03437 family)
MRFIVWAISCLSLYGQTMPPIQGAGYELPHMPHYAPGQVISIFVPGLSAPSTNSSTVPLPTTLAGVTVTAVEKRAGGFSADLPIFGITKAEYFGGDWWIEAPGITAITVQMPSLSICLPDSVLPNACWYVPHLVLTVKQNGNAAASSEFVQVYSSIHILNACDTAVAPFLTDSVRLTQLQGQCYPIISHADGSMVTGQNPAHPGETVAIYATGLGQFIGPLGSPAPTAGLPLDPSMMVIGFDFRPDIFGVIYGASAARPGGDAHPDYVGAVGGLVGIHQINVSLPAALPLETRACQRYGDTNVGINLAIGSSFDGARLCVIP